MVGAGVGRSRAGAGVDHCGSDNLLRTRLRLAKSRFDCSESIAGNGNRTRMASLEGWNFTIKLCPRFPSQINSCCEPRIVNAFGRMPKAARWKPALAFESGGN